MEIAHIQTKGPVSLFLDCRHRRQHKRCGQVFMAKCTCLMRFYCISFALNFVAVSLKILNILEIVFQGPGRHSNSQRR